MSIDGDEDPQGQRKDDAEAQWQAKLSTFLLEQRGRIRERIQANAPQDRKAWPLMPPSLKEKLLDFDEPLTDADRAAIKTQLTDLGLDAEFWRNENKLLLALLVALLTGVAQEAVLSEVAMAETVISVGVDWTGANTAAVEWAREHAAELAKGLDETTRRAVAGDVATWLDTPGEPIGTLFDKLERDYAFSQSRARNIAVTETTNAYAEGNAVAMREMEAEGWGIRKTWRTNNDDKVCPLCLPLHDATVIGVDTPFPDGTIRPARHPGCRCWLTYGVAD